MISLPATETAAPSVIPIDRRHLRAVRLFAAEKDIRYYLNGVLVHVLDDGAVRLVATNGVAIGITHTPNDGLFPPAPSEIIVPIEVVRLFAAHKSDTPIIISALDDGKTFKMECVGLSVNFAPIDGKFPNYEAVLPSAISGELAQFDTDLLQRFNKAAVIYGSKDARQLRIEHNGDGAALVHVRDEEFIGIVMPWRVGLRTGMPGWIKPGKLTQPADDESEGLPGIKTAEELAAETANDKPLNTVGNAEAPKRPSKREAKKAAEEAFE